MTKYSKETELSKGGTEIRRLSTCRMLDEVSRLSEKATQRKQME